MEPELPQTMAELARLTRAGISSPEWQRIDKALHGQLMKIAASVLSTKGRRLAGRSMRESTPPPDITT